jgi:hypothetical protein
VFGGCSTSEISLHSNHKKLNIKEKLREYDESQHQFATFLHNNYSNSAFYKPFLSKCDSAKLPKQTNKNYYSIPGW